MRTRCQILKRLAGTMLLAVVAAPPVIAGTWTAMLAHWGPPDPAAPINPVVHSTGLIIGEQSLDTRAIDDAGRSCPCGEIDRVELRVTTDGTTYIGHAFLCTPRRTIGFRTEEADISAFDFINPFGTSLPGFVRDDTDHEYDRATVYRACPATLAAVEAAIDANAGAGYQIGGWDGGLNCATWATRCLRAAGLAPPPGSFPNQLARHMPPVMEDAGLFDCGRGHYK